MAYSTAVDIGRGDAVMSLMAKADLEIEFEDYETAAYTYQKLLSVSPSSQLEAEVGLCRSYAGSGKSALAQKTCQQLVMNFPSNPDALLARARWYSTAGQFVLALADFNEADKIIRLPGGMFWRSSEIFEGRGYVLFKLNRYSEAINDFNKAVAQGLVATSAADTHQYLALSYLRTAQYELALKHWDRANKLSPSADAYYWKGRTLIKLEKFEEAQLSFKKALELDPSHENASRKFKLNRS